MLDCVSGETLDELLTNAILFVLPSDLEGLSLALVHFRIFDKLGISTRVELVLYAMNNGYPAKRSGWPGPGAHKGKSGFLPFENFAPRSV